MNDWRERCGQPTCASLDLNREIRKTDYDGIDGACLVPWAGMDCIHVVEARQMGLFAATGNRNGSRECVKNSTIVSSYFLKDFYEMI
jgi:hypothetical protein